MVITGALVRAQGVACHRGQVRGEQAGWPHQLAVWGLHTGQVVWYLQWQSCGIDIGEISSIMYATPLGSIALELVQVVGCHRGRRLGERTGQVCSACAGHSRLKTCPHNHSGRMGNVSSSANVRSKDSRTKAKQSLWEADTSPGPEDGGRGGT
jgi:hypothetical protein